MTLELSSLLCNMKLSRSASDQNVTPEPLYLPFPNVTRPQQPPGKQNSTAVPQDFIRLLNILPGSIPSIIECEFIVVRLDEAPLYEALSYVWGNPEPPEYVTCNGQRKSVTTNLEVALKYIRRQDEPRLIWVDALCINQDDVDERSSQIRLMRDIYTRTWRVVIWLGEDRGNKAEAAIQLLEMAAEDYSRQLQLPIDDITLLDLVKPANIKYFYGESLSTYISRTLTQVTVTDLEKTAWLCSHSWFERIWVIQEVAFAPATIHIGHRQIALKSVIVAVLQFIGTGVLKGLDPDHLRAFMQVKNMFLIGDVVGDDYVYLLQRVAPFLATDPRDKLFAILGLCRDVDRFNPDFQPNYAKDVVEVYTTFARAMASKKMGKARNGLGELYVLDPDPYTATDNRFPSWVPRWDRRKLSSGRFMSKPHWQVCGSTMAAVENADDPSIFSIRGLRIAPTKIVHHGLHREPNHLYAIIRIWDSILHSAKDGDLPTLDLKDFDERFTQTITAGAQFDANLQPSYEDGLWEAKEFHNYLQCAKLGMAGQYQSIVPEKKRQAELLVTFAEKKAFFILEDGQLGLGPNATEPKDIVGVFYGHRMPYVLRPVEDGKFLFLGPCFINGMMHGEALEGLKSGKYQEELFHLC